MEMRDHTAPFPPNPAVRKMKKGKLEAVPRKKKTPIFSKGSHSRGNSINTSFQIQKPPPCPHYDPVTQAIDFNFGSEDCFSPGSLGRNHKSTKIAHQTTPEAYKIVLTHHHPDELGRHSTVAEPDPLCKYYCKDKRMKTLTFLIAPILGVRFHCKCHKAVQFRSSLSSSCQSKVG